MARITVEDCLKKVNNRFVIVQMAFQRTKQLVKGSEPLVNRPENKKIVLSLREIAAGEVKLNEKSKKKLRFEEEPIED
jgi:DNA-directed RNA polymerase subunit omega